MVGRQRPASRNREYLSNAVPRVNRRTGLVARIHPVAAALPIFQIATEQSRTSLLARETIEVEFPNGSRMRIKPPVDPTALAATVAVLASGGRRRAVDDRSGSEPVCNN